MRVEEALRQLEPRWVPGVTSLGGKSTQTFGAERAHFVDRSRQVAFHIRCVLKA